MFMHVADSILSNNLHCEMVEACLLDRFLLWAPLILMKT